MNALMGKLKKDLPGDVLFMILGVMTGQLLQLF